MDYMNMAFEEAKKAFEEGEVPVGCIIVRNDKIIGKGHNRKESSGVVTRHAEIEAIEDACKNINDWRLSNTEMYVTLEPCIMCIGAILQSRVKVLHIGAFNKDMGSCGTVIDIPSINRVNTCLDIVWEYDDKCLKIISDFFRTRRIKK